MPSSSALRLGALLGALLVTAAPLRAQTAEMTKQEYFQYVPLTYPRIVRQTIADSIFQLYGPAAGNGFMDVAPRDGVDDTRGELLHALGVRFAPFMIRNTGNVPLDMQKAQEISGSTILTVDRWDIHAAARLVGTETVNFASLGDDPCPAGTVSRDSLLALLRVQTPIEDCRVLQLLREFNPNSPLAERFNTAAVPADADFFSVLYWNWPGYSPATWKAAFEDPGTGLMKEAYWPAISIYVHPFISPVGVLGSPDQRYEFILQYWFFYPYNDAGNKHEGDWEHINVVVSPMSQVTAPQTPDQIEALLRRTPDELGGADPLVIRRVDYYFHENMMPVDYSSPNAYAPRAEWRRQHQAISGEKYGMAEVAAIVRYRAWADTAETVVNTHPIAYIGANSKGLDLFLYSPGAHNQDGHGTYPFAGIYQGIGPADAAEEVKKGFDHQAYLTGGAPLPDYVEPFDSASRVKLLPDWERVYTQVYTDPDYRRDWAWFVLPIRSGYPAAKSPFAGIVSHAETGNLAPFTVTYNGGWNRSGASGGYHLYDPHRLHAIVTSSPLDQVQNNLGYLNAPIVALITLPPVDVIYKILLLPVRRMFGKFPVQYIPKAELPVRVMSVGGGVMTANMQSDWVALLLAGPQLGEILGRYVIADSSLTPSGQETDNAENATSYAVQMGFYLGKRWVTENTFHNSTSGLSISVPITDSPADPFDVTGTLNFYELASSIRYNLLTGGIQPYLKVGYGWSWYRVTDIATDGVPLSNPDGPWIRQPTFFPNNNLWPNTTHYGAGLEFFLLRSNAPLFRGVDVSLKGEWASYHSGLGVSFENAALLGFDSQPSVSRSTLSFFGVISF
ncbi:MAG: hypothetical protein R2910_03545 [Gemmatimonadales bacterium]